MRSWATQADADIAITKAAHRMFLLMGRASEGLLDQSIEGCAIRGAHCHNLNITFNNRRGENIRPVTRGGRSGLQHESVRPGGPGDPEVAVSLTAKCHCRQGVGPEIHAA